MAPLLDGIRDIVEADVDEAQMSAMLNAFVDENLIDIDTASVVFDLLAAMRIVSKYNFRRIIDGPPVPEKNTHWL